MKKIFSILMLCCLALNITGYQLFFYIQQAEIKGEMKEALRKQRNNQDETDFVFSLQDEKALTKIEWEGKNEFRFNGEMYDVIEKKINNGNVIIRCIADGKETALMQVYEKANKENNSKNRSALIIKIISSCYLFFENTQQFPRNITVPSIICFQSMLLPSRVSDVLTPPPQLS